MTTSSQNPEERPEVLAPHPETLVATPSNKPPRLLSSDDVLRGQKSVSINHNGALYRLQTTRQGKLILTK